MDRFGQPPRAWCDILEYINQTPLGRKNLEAFYPFHHKGRILIEPYPPDIRVRLLAASCSSPLGALFVTDGQQGIIYADLQSELGILIPFLFHEMVHSLDETLWDAARQSLTPVQKRGIIFEAECHAFSSQHQFQEELKEKYPELRLYHQTRFANIPFLNRALTREEIANLYKDSSSDLLK